MKKTFTANLNGTVFHIEEDAYDAIQRYLANIRAKFSGSSEAEEIMADIEARIAELFTERLQGRQAVSMADVDHVKQVMGQPEDYVDGESGTAGASAEDRSFNQAGPQRRKRLFRDPDDKKVAGVLSGLGHYFGIDPLWLRIAFLVFLLAGWGFPAIFYIALWVLVPEANTAAEKLEMQGEPVTVDNIKRMFEEGAEHVKAGAGKMADEAKEMGRKYWNQRSNYGYEANRAGRQVGQVFGKLVGIAMLVLAIVLLLALFTGLVGGSVGLWQATWTNEDIGLLDLASHLFNSRSQALLLMISAALLLVIPIIAIVLGGFRLLLGTPAPRWLGWTLTTLWILALVPAAWAGISLAKDFSRENSLRTEVPLAQPTGDVLTLDMLAPSDTGSTGWSVSFDHGDLDVDLDGFHLENGMMSGAWAELDVDASSDSLYHLLVIRTAHASTAKAALARAGRIGYNYKQHGDDLLLSPVVHFRTEDKIRGQEVRFLLQIPTGKSIFLRKGTAPMLDDVANTSNTWDRDMVGHQWTMTRAGLSMGNGEAAGPDSTGNKVNKDTLRHSGQFSPMDNSSGSGAPTAPTEPASPASLSMESTSTHMPNLFELLTLGMHP